MGACQSRRATALAVVDPKAASLNDIKLMSPTPKVSSPASSLHSSPEASPTSEERGLRELAAVKLGRLTRGFLERRRAEHRQRPCSSYRVDMKATGFANCHCGWSKSAHSAEALDAKKTVAQKKIRNEAELAKGFMQKELATCTRYEVNMTSENFGECLCGRAKAEHSAKAMAACDDKGRASLSRDSEALRASFVQREKTSCIKFVVDMNAETFGQCVCGAKRAEHTAAALAAAKIKAVKAVDGEELKRTKFVQRAMASCAEYVVNMEASRFGDCQCGRPRADHTNLALGAHGGRATSISTVVDSDELHKKFSKCEYIECEMYEVDMSNEVPFGQCLCGEPKTKHSEAAFRRRSSKEQAPTPSGAEVASSAVIATGQVLGLA